MKKIFALSILATSLLTLTACQSEEDDLFDTSAAERLMDSQKTYTKNLGNTTWVIEYYPTFYDELYKGEGYLILAQFGADQSVRMGMKNDASDGQYWEDTSLWEVITDQGPVLSFNSYNRVFHRFSDPGLSDSGRGLEQGEGYEGDYEFEVLSLTADADEAMLKGKKRGTYIRMTRLPDDTDFEAYLDNIDKFRNTYFSSGVPTPNYLFLGGKEYVATGANTGILSLYPKGGDAISETTDHIFLLTERNGDYRLRFREDVMLDSVNSVRELVYDSIGDIFRDVADTEFTLHGSLPAESFLTCTATLNRASRMSDDIATAVNALYTAMRRSNFTFTSLVFGAVTSDSILVDFRYRNNRNVNVDRYFYFTYQQDGEKLTLSYLGPQSTGAESFIESYPTLLALFQALSKEYAVEPTTTFFNQNNINFISAADPSSWFEVTLSN